MSTWLVIGVVLGAGFVLAGAGLAWRALRNPPRNDDDA